MGDKMTFFNSKHRFRVPVIQQLTQYECGLCCLNMILSYYRHDTSMSKLRMYFDSSVNGISLLELKNVAIKLNLKANVKKIDASTLLKVSLVDPIIIPWNNNHYIILEKISRNHCIVIDPDIGKRKITYEEFIAGFSGYILLLHPNGNFKQYKTKSNITDYFKYLLVYKKLILSVLMISIVLQCISIGVPLLIQNVVDNVILSHNYTLSALMIVTVILIILQTILTYFKNRLIIWFQNKVDYSLMSKFINHMIRLKYKFFQLRTRGDLIQRLNSNIMIRDIFIQKIIPASINMLLLIILFIYMFSQSRILTISVLFLAITQFVVIIVNKSKMRLLTQAEVISQTDTSTFLTEMLSGISTIKTLGLENHMSKLWDNILKNQIQKVSNKSRFQNNVDILINGIVFFAPLFIIFLGANEVVNNNITIGQLIAFLSLTGSFLDPISFLANIINDITMLVVLLERIYDILDENIEESGSILLEEKVSGNISLTNVSFKYSENSPYVLKNINLDINKGEKVAIVGKSGCGKSTLGLLICALYKPNEGNITIDNIDYSKINKNNLRNNFGVVLQDNFLFNRTISENISVGIPNMESGEIELSAKIAEIHQDIMKLPMKYDSILSESGSNLSGGQKQRISIARVVARKPSILLLDEATSSLDSITEKRIVENIKTLSCTQVIIAHRLETIKNADKIIVLKNGSISDVGAHEELIKNCTYYKELYNSNNNVL